MEKFADAKSVRQTTTMVLAIRARERNQVDH